MLSYKEKLNKLDRSIEWSSIHSSNKLIKSLVENLNSRKLILKELRKFLLEKSWPAKSLIPRRKKSLNIGWKFSLIQKLLPSRSNKSMNLCWSILKRLKLKRQKIWKDSQFISTFQKTNGSQTLKLANISTLKKPKSKKVTETKLTGKKERTSQWRQLRKKERKVEKKQNKSNNHPSSTFSNRSSLPPMMKNKTLMNLKTKKTKLRNLNSNMKFSRTFTKMSFQRVLNTILISLEVAANVRMRTVMMMHVASKQESMTIKLSMKKMMNEDEDRNVHARFINHVL